MVEEDLNINFAHEWTQHIQNIRKSLNSFELDTIDKNRSIENVRDIIGDGTKGPIPAWKLSLSSFEAFVEFFKTKLEANLDAHFFWGALACLLQLVDRYPNGLVDVPYLLRSLAIKAKVFNEKWNDPQLVGCPFREVCFIIQVVFVNFFTDLIRYTHTNSDDLNEQHEGDNRASSKFISQSYEKTNREIEQAMAWIENPHRANLPMRIPIPSSSNANEAASNIRCQILPPTVTAGHFDRESYFKKLDNILRPSVEEAQFISVVLHGTEGVGKSAIASTYIERRYRDNVYDVVLWICGESRTSFRQSFTDIAMGLKLPGANHQTPDENFGLLQEWFRTTECKWLVVYDNVRSSEEREHYWPRTTKGRAIVTTSNHEDLHMFPGEKLEVNHWPDDMGWKYLMFLLKYDDETRLESSEKEAAVYLSGELSGHPLSILLIAGLIHNGGCSVRDFMDMYRKDADRFHGMDEFAKLWRHALKELDKESHALLAVMSWLMPDSIPLELFEKGVNRGSADGLEFCLHGSDFLRVITKLLNPYLIKRNNKSRVLSIHRVIQMRFKSSLDTEQRQNSFDRAVGLLYNILPKQDTLKGQLYGDWEIYNRYLQHVSYLKDCFVVESRGSKPLNATVKFCELLIQCQRYLYEINALADLKSFCDVSLAAVNTLDNRLQKEGLEADIMSYLANRAESLGYAETAIILNKKIYNIRQRMKEELLGHVTNNIGYCYNSANDHEEALKWLNKSYKWWRERKKPIPSFLHTNRARCMIYHGDAIQARELLGTAIKQLQEEEDKDWAMLAYTYFVQGTLEQREKHSISAENFFRKAANSWMKNDKRLHPFYGGCMYRIGVCCLEQGKIEDAIKNLCISMEVTSFHKDETPIEHIRNQIKLSQVLSQDSLASGQREDAKKWFDGQWLNQAKIDARQRHPEVPDWSSEDVYDNLIPIFWR